MATKQNEDIELTLRTLVGTVGTQRKERLAGWEKEKKASQNAHQTPP